MHKRNALQDRLYLRGSVWWVWGYDSEGAKYRESTGQTERKSALAVAKQIETRRALPPDQAASAFTLGEALIGLADEDTRANAKENTVRFHRDRGRHLLRVLGGDSIVALYDDARMNEYMDTRLKEGDSRHTIQKEFRVLIQALRVAGSKYKGEPGKLMPRALRKQKAYYKPRDRWLENAEQCQALLDNTSTGGEHVNIDRKLHIAAYIHTGLRENELLVICPEHVQLEARRVWIVGEKTEDASRWMWLSETAVEIFRRKLRDDKGQAKPRGRPIFEPWEKVDRDLKANWRRARRQLVARAEAEGRDPGNLPELISLNDLRRTFCSLMATAGVPMQHCAKLMGHRSLDMVMTVYGRLAPESLISAVDMLPKLALPTVSVLVHAGLPKAALDDVG